MSPKTTPTKEQIARRIMELERFKENNKLSWDDVAKEFETHKKTILRWRKGKMSGMSYKVLGRALNMGYFTRNRFIAKQVQDAQEKLSKFEDFSSLEE